LELARRFDGELICADSWTVYKEFNVGTAKPTKAEQAEIRHHLLDIADPARGFSAVEFQRLAKQVIKDIVSRGKLPIMVGGTGLYIDSVLYDYQFLPAPDPAERERLNQLSLDELIRLTEERALSTDGIDMRNKRRVIRLLENDGIRPDKGTLRLDTLIMGIATDREHLRQRITRRVDAMLAAGLEQEVKKLAQRYGWQVEPMKGIGYREWRAYVEPEDPAAGYDGQSLEQTRQRIISATMQLAKRQRTWFKPLDETNYQGRIHWLSQTDALAQAVAYTTTFTRK